MTLDKVLQLCVPISSSVKQGQSGSASGVVKNNLERGQRERCERATSVSGAAWPGAPGSACSAKPCRRGYVQKDHIEGSSTFYPLSQSPQ